eukprot:scaffold101228_cov20-Tisochrysis_lutea.AAC.1
MPVCMHVLMQLRASEASHAAALHELAALTTKLEQERNKWASEQVAACSSQIYPHAPLQLTAMAA